MIVLARNIADQLEREGYSVAIINARFIKPLDEECILKYARRAKLVCTIEDHSIKGGFGSTVLECLSSGNVTTPVEIVGWPDRFIEHGCLKSLREKYGLTEPDILDRLHARLGAATSHPDNGCGE